MLRSPADVPEAGLSAEYRALCGGGGSRSIVFRGRVERDAGGEPVRWVAAAQEVSATSTAGPQTPGGADRSGTDRAAEARPASHTLTDRETEVLNLAAAGNSGPRIAERLYVSPSTIKTHFEHIYGKLGVADRTSAVAHAIRAGLIR